MTNVSPPDARHERRRMLVIVAALVLLLCVVPVAIWLSSRESSAAFSDTEILDDNQLGAATVDIELGSEEALFNAVNLAPGDRVSGHLEVTNVGSLPVLLDLSAESSAGPLADWLVFSAWTVPDACQADDIEAGRATALSEDFILEGGTGQRIGPPDQQLRLAPEEQIVLCLGAELRLDASNEVQGQTLAVNLVLDAVHDLEAEQP